MIHRRVPNWPQIPVLFTDKQDWNRTIMINGYFLVLKRYGKLSERYAFNHKIFCYLIYWELKAWL